MILLQFHQNFNINFINYWESKYKNRPRKESKTGPRAVCEKNLKTFYSYSLKGPKAKQSQNAEKFFSKTNKNCWTRRNGMKNYLFFISAKIYNLIIIFVGTFYRINDCWTLVIFQTLTDGEFLKKGYLFPYSFFLLVRFSISRLYMINMRIPQMGSLYFLLDPTLRVLEPIL